MSIDLWNKTLKLADRALHIPTYIIKTSGQARDAVAEWLALGTDIIEN